ncbi:MAG: NADH-quinone oxidoreductase subunit L [Gemmatimonadota bacterium]
MAHLAWLVVVLPLLGAVVNGTLAFHRPTARTLISFTGAGVLVAAFAVAVAVFLEVREHEVGFRLLLWQWMPVSERLHIDLTLQFDRLSTVLMLVITGVGSLIHIFSIGYMREDPGYARYFAYLNLFVAFMLVLVLGASLPVSFIGWEGVGLCSYLLIGFWFEVNANSSAGKKAFLANRVGDFGVLVAMFLIWWTVGTLDFDGIAAAAPTALVAGGSTVVLITMLLFLGCTGKSAQIPLFTWLPDAMAGPTPVSALIHAATMVTAGVFLVVRTGVLFAMAPITMEVVALIGALTAFFAATVALKQNDIKKVLAYSTISQLGYMFLAVGSGAWTAGLFHLVTHAFFKALLFLGAGSVIHSMHGAYHATHSHADAQDMRNMGGLRRRMPWTFALMLIATLALAGVPPLAGFFSKDEILASVFARGGTNPIYLIAWVLGLLAAFCTAFYMARLMTMTFLGTFRSGDESEAHLHEAPPIMTGPLVVLGALTVLGGLLNLPSFIGGHHSLEQWLEPVVAPANALLAAVHHPEGSAELLLVVGAIAIALGGLAFGYRATVRATIPRPSDASPERGIARLLAGKYFVDEFYQRVIVGPTVWFSETVLWKGFDQFLVDRLGVGGTVRISEGLGWLGSRLQNGQVTLYVSLFAAGAILVIRALVGG